MSGMAGLDSQAHQCKSTVAHKVPLTRRDSLATISTAVTSPTRGRESGGKFGPKQMLMFCVETETKCVCVFIVADN